MTQKLALDEQWDEMDLIQFEESKTQHSRMGAQNMNRKQKDTAGQVFKIEEQVSASEVEQNVRTFITHNKGGKWELIKAPETFPNGKRTGCYLEDNCSLHLEIYSHMGELSPVYSTEKAVGLVLGTGNMGERLTENNQKKSLYMSRDGGLNWSIIRGGTHIYDIGDHGALVVIAPKGSATRHVEFTWDEGQTWEKLQISERDLIVDNIIIEPSSISQQFMVYGTYAEPVAEVGENMDAPAKDGKVFSFADASKASAQGDHAFMVYLDFSQLHEPQC